MRPFSAISHELAVVEFNGNVYFFARFGDNSGAAGLYRTDGTPANTVLVELFDAITDMDGLP